MRLLDFHTGKSTSNFLQVKRKKLRPSLSSCRSSPSHRVADVEDACLSASSSKHRDSIPTSISWGRAIYPRLRSLLAKGPGIANWECPAARAVRTRGPHFQHMMSPARCEHVRDSWAQPETSDMDPSSSLHVRGRLAEQPQKCTPPSHKYQGEGAREAAETDASSTRNITAKVSSTSAMDHSSSRNIRVGMQTTLAYKSFL